VRINTSNHRWLTHEDKKNGVNKGRKCNEKGETERRIKPGREGCPAPLIFKSLHSRLFSPPRNEKGELWAKEFYHTDPLAVASSAEKKKGRCFRWGESDIVCLQEETQIIAKREQAEKRLGGLRNCSR